MSLSFSAQAGNSCRVGISCDCMECGVPAKQASGNAFGGVSGVSLCKMPGTFPGCRPGFGLGFRVVLAELTLTALRIQGSLHGDFYLADLQSLFRQGLLQDLQIGFQIVAHRLGLGDNSCGHTRRIRDGSDLHLAEERRPQLNPHLAAVAKCDYPDAIGQLKGERFGSLGRCGGPQKRDLTHPRRPAVAPYRRHRNPAGCVRLFITRHSAG